MTGFVKCNLDAAIFKDSYSYGTDIVIRDSNGIFLKARSSTHNRIPTPTEAEA